MKAVNLIPSDHRVAKSAAPLDFRSPSVLIVGVLGVALALVTFYVLTSNSISSNKSKLASVKQQLVRDQALASQLGAYGQFSALAQQRAQTVRQIAGSRFDWATSLAQLAQVVPANTSLQALNATVSNTSGSSSSAASGSGSGLRGALPDPAFELKGCTGSQDDVARLMSRLRLMNGVVDVTLAQSAKTGSTPGIASTAGPAAGAGSANSAGCGADSPTFDLVVFFQPPPAIPTPSSGSQPRPAAASPAASASSLASSTSSTTSSSTSSTTPPSVPGG